MVLPVIAGQLPSGFCATDYQSILNEFSAHQTVDVGPSSGVNVVVSSTKPTDETVLWQRLDQFGRPERIYWFASGAWLSRHPMVSGLTVIWTDALPDFTTFDGGDALAPSVLSGPMWEVVATLAARFPIGAGTLPSGAVVAIGDQAGEEKHVLTQAELPASWTGITAVLKGWRTNLETLAAQWLAPSAAAGGGPTTPATETGTFNFDNAGGGQGHSVIPPYLGVTFIRRTNRVFYAIA